MKKVAKIILRKEGKILLQFRNNNPDIPFPNTWSLFGGLIGNNESAKECVAREIKEELNATLKNVKKITTQTRVENGEKVKDNIFSADIIEDINDLKLTEGQEMRLFSLKELNEIKIASHYEKHIKDFLRKNSLN